VRENADGTDSVSFSVPCAVPSIIALAVCLLTSLR